MLYIYLLLGVYAYHPVFVEVKGQLLGVCLPSLLSYRLSYYFFCVALSRLVGHKLLCNTSVSASLLLLSVVDSGHLTQVIKHAWQASTC